MNPTPPPYRKSRTGRIVLIVLGSLVALCGLGVLIAALSGGGGTQVDGQGAAAPTTAGTDGTITPAAPAGTTLSGGGVLLVPSEVKPGTYRAAVPADENCYWARLKGTSGDFDEIIANGNAEGGERVTVTVRATDKAFQFTPGCGAWTKIG